MKEFAYLYPVAEYIDFHVGVKNHGKRQRYSDLLARAVDLRYRQQGLGINYVLFRDHAISELIKPQPGDRIIEADITYKTLLGKEKGEKQRYADPDYILDQLPGTTDLTLAGFHLWDCVEKVASRAHQRGINTFVDEELTDAFNFRLEDQHFNPSVFTALSALQLGVDLDKMWQNRRQGRPWMWQG